MLAWHEHAIATVTLADTRATDPQVRSLAAQTAKVQNLQRTNMATLLAGWAQPTAPPGDDPDEHVRTLTEAKGTAFDRLLVESMIAHDESVIAAARDVLTKDPGTLVRGVASSIIIGLPAEIEQLRLLHDRLPGARTTT